MSAVLALMLASWPLPPDAGAGAYANPANWPNDPGYANQWPLFGFVPSDAGISAAEAQRGRVGASVDRAWSVTTGSPRVVIAIVGEAGPLSDAPLSSRWALNLAELPPPQGDGGYDVNGDGRVDVRDYAGDSRVHDGNANGFIDCDDLLTAFADGTDQDGNGRADDLCGWDFIAQGPHALKADAGADDFSQLGTPANDGTANAGVCPDCALLAAPASSTAIALTAALKALTGRARVVVLPTISASSGELEQAIADATDAGTLVIASGANAPTIGTEQPAALNEVLSTGMLGIDTTDWTHATTFLVPGNCSGHGPQVRAAVASDRCAAGAAMMTAGIAGLAFSAALQHGHPLDAARLRGWMSAQDLDARALVDRAAAGDTTDTPRVTAPAPYRYVSRSNGFDLAATGTDSASVCLASTDAGCITVPLTNGSGHLDKVSLSGGLAALTPLTQALRLEPTGGGERTLVFGVDDSAMYGLYPLEVPGIGASPPRLVDLDGDGSDDLIVAGVDGRIHVLTGSGQESPGFPVDAGGTIEQPLAFDDLFGVGHPNLIAVTREGQLTVFSSTGLPLTGFPVDLGAQPGVPVAVSTQTGELILVGDALGRLHAITPLGKESKGSPLALDSSLPGAMAAADLDGDGWPEALIPFATQSFLVTVAGDGIAVRPGWPIPATAGAALFADIDRDGTTELILDAIYDTGGSRRLAPLEKVKPAQSYVTDLVGDGVRDWYVVEDTHPATIHRYQATPALGMGSSMISDAPGWPIHTFDSAASAVIAQATGTDWQLLVPDAADALWAFDTAGNTPAPFPLPAPGSITGTALGLTQGNLVLAATSRTGRVMLRNLTGVSDSIRWDGFQHDRANSGSLATPLPLRKMPGIGVPLGPVAKSGCCNQSVGDPLFPLAMLLLLARRQFLGKRRRA